MKFREFIRNKRVVFVGACPNLVGRNLGSEIDNFNIVCKSNGSLFLETPDYYKDYGSHIDVLYTNNQFYREMFPEFVDFAKVKGVKFIRMKTVKEHDRMFIDSKIHAETITQSIKAVNIKSATMGCYILTDLLACHPKELHLTGVDFFLSKKKAFEHDNYREYLPNYLPKKIREQGNRINQGKTEDGHDIQASAKYILKLYRANEGIFTMPKFIEDILVGVASGKLTQE